MRASNTELIIVAVLWSVFGGWCAWVSVTSQQSVVATALVAMLTLVGGAIFLGGLQRRPRPAASPRVSLPRMWVHRGLRRSF
jgi:hypothetical protein